MTTLKELRDRAILAALIGSRLRRPAAAALTFDRGTQREGRSSKASPMTTPFFGLLADTLLS